MSNRFDDDSDSYEAGDILKAIVIVMCVYLALSLMVDDCIVTVPHQEQPTAVSTTS